jgi:hypothetical protein
MSSDLAGVAPAAVGITARQTAPPAGAHTDGVAWTPQQIAAVLPGATCDCGAVLHVEPCGSDDWSWHDEDGRMLVDRSPAGYNEDPKGWWARLAATDPATYSDLLCRWTLGYLGWWHGHGPATPEPWTGPPAPTCCAMPMRLSPRGWVCREGCERRIAVTADPRTTATQ